jgi:hypothetical protein
MILVATSPPFTAKGPYKPTDENRGLHQRLAIHNRHFIPIGFYDVKWLEKLRFHLDNRGDDDGNTSSSSDSSGSSKRAEKTKIKDKAASRHQCSSKRPKIDEDKSTSSKKPSPSEIEYTYGGEQLSQADYMRKKRASYLEFTKMATSSAAAPRQATR